MSDTEKTDISFDALDEMLSPRGDAVGFDGVIARVMNRRQVLAGGAALGGVLLSGTGASQGQAASRLDFDAVPANTLDTVTVPAGYSWYVVASWGEPLWSGGVEFDGETRGTAASQALAFGDNNDGMAVFSRDGHTLLAVNNEYTNVRVMFGNREASRPETDDDVRKGMAAHGVSVVEITELDGRWRMVKDSAFNRRITATTPMMLTGPARGHDLLKTTEDPQGEMSLGTWNNCGCGRTPWGTYLTCEENFNGYFSASDEFFEPTAAMARYGLRAQDWGYGWARVDQRFDLSKHPNEPNRNGYVVEIDPWDPASVPRKLTALGRFKHENAELAVARDGRIVVYMGDDERGEYLYRYVSDGVYEEQGDTSKLLEDGRLYVARFEDDLRGQWIELTSATTGMADADICILTRVAASAAGATTMDRPEWVAANPHTAEVYCALTGDRFRGVTSNAGGVETPPGGPNPRKENIYGQIVRWRPDNDDHAADGFTWDLFVLCGNPTVYDNDRRGSANVTAQNMFSAPDGLRFDGQGVLWIQTDGQTGNQGHFSGMGNNQMLAGDASTGEIRRFMVGPRECEVSGLDWSPDRRTMFVGIQHPGDRGGSHFPGGGDSVPRSSIIAITRDDGGLVG
jgi:secreted PhoX family phosphatase